jgi:hypothetical protein
MHDEHALEDSYLKVARAKEQIDSLGAEVQKTTAENPVEILGSENVKTGQRIFKIPNVPRWPSWEVIVGEIGHNLRSALDYVVYQLAVNSEEQRTAFPISTSEKAYLKPRGRRKVSYRNTCLAGVDPKWAAWIDKLQPFNDPFPVDGANGLALLNLLSNRDKHRARLPCYTLIRLPSVVVTVDNPVFIKNLEVREEADGAVVVKQDARADRRSVKEGRMSVGLDPKEPGDTGTGLDIAFSRRRVLLPQIAILVGFVEFIVDSFDPAFRPAARAD